MEIPGIGALSFDPDDEWYVSDPVPVPVLGRRCRFVLQDGEGYTEDPEPFNQATAAFLALDDSVLAAAAPAVHEYYLDIAAAFDREGWDHTRVAGPDDVWNHVTFGSEVTIEREGSVYLSVECECSWEVEHGLQLVFREGRAISRVGPYDGELVNDPDVVYPSDRMRPE
ncbi:DUF6985 domain-containing protein [Actinoplanes sp. GCM10030250]|uniref:DUF6985 domain-containing protein n=1 Tax=Actinoplanes sp. GCM10030250 TaxID=3273376 RepID=UPI00360EFBC6